ncbi:MAG: hypothetical protein IJW82_02450, partial [Clostridia bacterium]|nr:hypothetical protein [Clostridia bacterium]
MEFTKKIFKRKTYFIVSVFVMLAMILSVTYTAIKLKPTKNSWVSAYSSVLTSDEKTRAQQIIESDFLLTEYDSDGGTGATNKYEVDSCLDLIYLSWIYDTSMTNTIFKTFTYFCQTADIDMSIESIENALSGYASSDKTILMKVAKNFVPIGSTDNPFKNFYEGYSYKISNLSIVSTKDNSGLFGVVEGGETSKRGHIVNVVMEDFTMTSSIGNSGVICGKLYNGVISDCVTSGTITLDTSNACVVGGLVGLATGTVPSQIYNVNSSVNIDYKTTSNDISYIGGICGRVENAELDSVITTGAIDIQSSSSMYVGGIAGEVSEASKLNLVKNNQSVLVYMLDNLPNVYIGGIAGINKGEINSSLNTATISGYGQNDTGINIVNTHIGGLIGVNESMVTNSYNTGLVQSDRFSGGLVCENYGNISYCFNQGQISTYTQLANTFTGITAVNAYQYFGGLTAVNEGEISYSYNVGEINVKASVNPSRSTAGGLTAILGIEKIGKIKHSYSSLAFSGSGYTSLGIGYDLNDTEYSLSNFNNVYYYPNGTSSVAVQGPTNSYQELEIGDITMFATMETLGSLKNALTNSSFNDSFGSVTGVNSGLPALKNLQWALNEWEENTGDSFYTEINATTKGTPENPIEIYDTKQLAYIVNRINNGSKLGNGMFYYEASYLLKSNIDLSGKLWTSIGTSDYPFVGEFKVSSDNIFVSNMNIINYESNNDIYSGFFGVVGNSSYITETNATISNLSLIDGFIASVYLSNGAIQNLYVGGVSGLVNNNNITTQGLEAKEAYTLIENSYFTGVIYSNDLAIETSQIKNSYIGGISGLLNGVVERCYNEATIYSNSNINNYVGGIVGSTNTTYSYIDTAYNGGKITAKGLGNQIVGGVSGKMNAMTYVYNVGDIEATQGYGLSSYATSVNFAYVNSNIKVQENQTNNALLSQEISSLSPSNFTNIYYLDTLQNELTDFDFVALTKLQMVTRSSYENFDFGDKQSGAKWNTAVGINNNLPFLNELTDAQKDIYAVTILVEVPTDYIEITINGETPYYDTTEGVYKITNFVKGESCEIVLTPLSEGYYIKSVTEDGNVYYASDLGLNSSMSETLNYVVAFNSSGILKKESYIISVEKGNVGYTIEMVQDSNDWGVILSNAVTDLPNLEDITEKTKPLSYNEMVTFYAYARQDYYIKNAYVYTVNALGEIIIIDDNVELLWTSNTNQNQVPTSVFKRDKVVINYTPNEESYSKVVNNILCVTVECYPIYLYDFGLDLIVNENGETLSEDGKTFDTRTENSDFVLKNEDDKYFYEYSKSPSIDSQFGYTIKIYGVENFIDGKYHYSTDNGLYVDISLVSSDGKKLAFSNQTLPKFEYMTNNILNSVTNGIDIQEVNEENQIFGVYYGWKEDLIKDCFNSQKETSSFFKFTITLDLEVVYYSLIVDSQSQ